MTSFLVRMFGRLLHLYPQPFREEFAEEMQTVFADEAEEAAKRGLASFLVVCLRELGDSPMCILREHLRERGKLHMATNGWLSSKLGSWPEFLLASAPFGLFALIFLVNLLGLATAWLSTGMVGLLILLVILFLVGLFEGLPRWSLPYLGMLASILSLVVSGAWLRLQDILPRFGSPVLADVYIKGSTFLGLIVLTLVFVLVTAVLPPLRSLYGRLRQDWSLLSFALYGVTPLALFMSFDDYRFEEPYELVALLVLVVGAWIYLNRSEPAHRVTALLAGVTLVMAVALVGHWVLAPYQPLIEYWRSQDLEQARWNALASAAVLFLGLVILALGTWGCFRKLESARRALILLASATIALVVVLVGHWMIAPYLSWAGYWTSRELEQSHWNAFSSTTVLWGWLVAIVIATPALISVLIRPGHRVEFS